MTALLTDMYAFPSLRIPLPYLLFIHDEIFEQQTKSEASRNKHFLKTECKLIAKTIKMIENKNSKSSFFGNFRN